MRVTPLHDDCSIYKKNQSLLFIILEKVFKAEKGLIIKPITRVNHHD